MTTGNKLRLTGALQYGAVAALCFIAALTLGVKAAKADMRVDCNFAYGYAGCALRDGNHADPNAQKISPEDAAAAKARDEAWVARCNPTFRIDEYGVTRYVYAAKGCEFGN